MWRLWELKQSSSFKVILPAHPRPRPGLIFQFLHVEELIEEVRGRWHASWKCFGHVRPAGHPKAKQSHNWGFKTLLSLISQMEKTGWSGLHSWNCCHLKIWEPQIIQGIMTKVFMKSRFWTVGTKGMHWFSSFLLLLNTRFSGQSPPDVTSRPINDPRANVNWTRRAVIMYIKSTSQYSGADTGARRGDAQWHRRVKGRDIFPPVNSIQMCPLQPWMWKVYVTVNPEIF